MTAAVVGVVLNLAVWFSLHVLFGTVNEVQTLGLRLHVPVWRTVDVRSVVIAIAAFLAIFVFKIGVMRTLGGSVLLRFLLHVLTRPQ